MSECKSFDAANRGSLPQETRNGKLVWLLPDELNVTIGGVVYHVRSVFGEQHQMGELLDLATLENIKRCA